MCLIENPQRHDETACSNDFDNATLNPTRAHFSDQDDEYCSTAEFQQF